MRADGAVDESFQDPSELSKVSRRLTDDEVSESEDVEIRKKVGLRKGQDPDPREPSERPTVIQQLILEPHQPSAEAAEHRLQIALLLTGVVEEPLPIDEQERDVGAEQRLKRGDPAPSDLRILHLFFEPLPGVVVPNESQRVERLRVACAALLSRSFTRNENVVFENRVVSGRRASFIPK